MSNTTAFEYRNTARALFISKRSNILVHSAVYVTHTTNH